MIPRIQPSTCATARSAATERDSRIRSSCHRDRLAASRRQQHKHPADHPCDPHVHSSAATKLDKLRLRLNAQAEFPIRQKARSGSGRPAFGADSATRAVPHGSTWPPNLVHHSETPTWPIRHALPSTCASGYCRNVLHRCHRCRNE